MIPSLSSHHLLCRKILIILLFVLCINGSISAPVDNADAMVYLLKFGYISPSAKSLGNGALVDEDTSTKAIKEFQSFAGLNVSGELDPETVEMMALPRCGVKDVIDPPTGSRSKRHVLQGSRWNVKNLSYSITKYPHNSRMTKEEVDDELRRAFEVWSTHTDLVFTQVHSGKVHIEISFEKGEHGDGDPFDGRGGTLAHAYFPSFGGDAHFDDAEEWTAKSYRGTSLFQTAAHEFGHSLGLGHSEVNTALMAPFYRGYDPTFTLDIDDITGIQKLYGKKTVYKPSVTIPPPKQGNDIICSNPKIDAIFNSAEGETYAFKGEYYYKITEKGIDIGYPRLISSTWIGLPGDIDTAFTHKNGKTYFYKGNMYWKYHGKVMDGNYPKRISDGFNGIPDNLDASLVWPGSGKIFFFKGAEFWSFDPALKPPVKSIYPKSLITWKGLPSNLDAAFQYTNGGIFFFKGEVYYRFNEHTHSVDDETPPFPRPIGYWWLGCNTPAEIPIAVDQGEPNTTDRPEIRPEIVPNSNGNSGHILQSSLLTRILIILACIWHLSNYKSA